MAAKADIDTSVPFQSVKDAVMLFGTGTLSRGKHAAQRPKPDSEERVLTQETKLHLALKELSQLKQKIKNTEITKAEALSELEKAKILVDDLSDKLRAADESRESAIGATEVSGNQGKQNQEADSAQKQDLESAVENNTTVFSIVDQKMQELEKIYKNMRSVEEVHHWDSVRAVTSKLDIAKESLQRVAEEEIGLCKMLETLKLEFDTVQKEHAELMEKERETENIARDLQVQLQKTKSHLEMCCVEGSKANEALGETIATLELKTEAEELKKEAEDVKIELQELEEELKATLFEAEVAKAAVERALECVNRFTLCERTDVAETSFSESTVRVTISREKFLSLHQKAEEFSNLAEIKVTAALAQVDATRVCTDEALKKLEMSQREIKDLQAARTEALKKAETAERAKRAVEAELTRWREKEQKKTAEKAARILAETEIPVKSSPHHPEILKGNSGEQLQKSETCVSKRVRLLSVRGIFHQRKKQDDARFASCLPS